MQTSNSTILSGDAVSEAWRTLAQVYEETSQEVNFLTIFEAVVESSSNDDQAKQLKKYLEGFFLHLKGPDGVLYYSIKRTPRRKPIIFGSPSFVLMHNLMLRLPTPMGMGKVPMTERCSQG